MIGVLVDLSSSILHQRRAPGIGRPEQSKPLQKTIGFLTPNCRRLVFVHVGQRIHFRPNQTRRLAINPINPEKTLRPLARPPLQRHAGGDKSVLLAKAANTMLID